MPGRERIETTRPFLVSGPMTGSAASVDHPGPSPGPLAALPPTRTGPIQDGPVPIPEPDAAGRCPLGGPAPGPGLRLAGLSVVELEVGSRCNRACSYCPVSLDPRPPVLARMGEEVFEAVVRQLAAAAFAGRISYHLYNEPLLRRDLARLVATVDQVLPEALQLLNTNGDLLDDARYAELREAGVDYFYVTRHEPGPYPQRPFQVVQYADALTLTNRGGALPHLPAPSTEAPRTSCWAPSEMLVVTVSGDVLLCYEDARREHVLGNVLASGLTEIWNDPGTVRLRERLRGGARNATSICRACSNTSHATPGRSALEDPVLAVTGMERGPDAVATLKRRSRDARRAEAPGTGLAHGVPTPSGVPGPVPASAFRMSRLFEERLNPQVAHGGQGQIEAVRVATGAVLAGGCNFIDFVQLPPGTSIGEHAHGLDEEEFYLVLSGTGLLQLGEDRIPVGPGDLIRNPPGGIHGLANTGRTTVRLVVFELSVPKEVSRDG